MKHATQRNTQNITGVFLIFLILVH